jgi:hypothetical protein
MYLRTAIIGCLPRSAAISDRRDTHQALERFAECRFGAIADAGGNVTESYPLAPQVSPC